MKKYNLNENFFETIDTEEKAYWLGFIAADGYISEKNKKYLQILLHRNEYKHIEKFLNSIESNQKVRIEEKYCRVLINRKKMVQDLIKLGIVQNKSKLKLWPNIGPLLIKHYIRGYFDGDGSFIVDKKNSIRFQIVGVNIETLKEIQNFLSKRLNLNITKIIWTGTCWRVSYGGKNQVKKIFDLLYQNVSIFLDRKFNLIQNYYLNNKLNFTNQPKLISRDDGIIYKSINEAARQNNISHRSIVNCLNGKTQLCNGYKWNYVRE